MQECLGTLKKERDAVGRRLSEIARRGVRVLLGDALWSLDGTHLGRLLEGTAVSGLVIREVASTRTLLVSVGPAATAEDLVRALEQVRVARGGLPLVVAEDNGPPRKSDLVADYGAFHGVVLLRNEPHVSEHDSRVEHGRREWKEEAGLGKGVVLESAEEAARRLEEAVGCVDGRRLRTTRGLKAAVVMDAEMTRQYTSVDREAFYGAAFRAIQEAVQGCESDRERRQAEREAIQQTLQAFGLIERTRGGRPVPTSERKSFP